MQRIVDLSFPALSPFTIGEIHLHRRAFAFPRGEYALSFRWETEEGELFSDVVRVYVDLDDGTPLAAAGYAALHHRQSRERTTAAGCATGRFLWPRPGSACS